MSNLSTLSFDQNTLEGAQLSAAAGASDEQIVTIAAGSSYTTTTSSKAITIAAESLVGIKLKRNDSVFATHAGILNFSIELPTEFVVEITNNGDTSVKVQYLAVTDTGNDASRQEVASILANWVVCKNAGTQVPGIKGDSAYQVAQSEGYVGTEPQWVASLRGDSAYRVAVTSGYSGTEIQWLASLHGRDAEFDYSNYVGYDLPSKVNPDLDKPEETGKVTTLAQAVNHCYLTSEWGKARIIESAKQVGLPVQDRMTHYEISQVIDTIDSFTFALRGKDVSPSITSIDTITEYGTEVGSVGVSGAPTINVFGWNDQGRDVTYNWQITDSASLITV